MKSRLVLFIAIFAIVLVNFANSVKGAKLDGAVDGGKKEKNSKDKNNMSSEEDGDKPFSPLNFLQDVLKLKFGSGDGDDDDDNNNVINFFRILGNSTTMNKGMRKRLFQGLTTAYAIGSFIHILGIDAKIKHYIMSSIANRVNRKYEEDYDDAPYGHYPIPHYPAPMGKRPFAKSRRYHKK